MFRFGFFCVLCAPATKFAEKVKENRINPVIKMRTSVRASEQANTKDRVQWRSVCECVVKKIGTLDYYYFFLLLLLPLGCCFFARALS